MHKYNFIVIIKVKVVPVFFNRAPGHKGVLGSGGIAPLIP
jgi:hypothetical protein